MQYQKTKNIIVIKIKEKQKKGYTMQTTIKIKKDTFKIITQYYGGCDGLYIAIYKNGSFMVQIALSMKKEKGEEKFHKTIVSDKDFKKYLKGLK